MKSGVREQFKSCAKSYGRLERLQGWSAPEHVMTAIEDLDIPSETPMKVLVLGLGTGHDAALIHELFPNSDIHGCDYSQDMIDVAVEDGRVDADKVKAADLRKDFPYDDDSFDLVVCCGTAEYLGPAERVVSEMARVAKPGGNIISTFRDDCLSNKSMHWLGAFQNALSFIPGISPIGDKSVCKSDDLESAVSGRFSKVSCSEPYTAYYQTLLIPGPYINPPIKYFTFSGQK